jgi:hypothetical protein
VSPQHHVRDGFNRACARRSDTPTRLQGRDDQDECIQDVGEQTTVFKVRNGGNFDFDERKWPSTAKLTRLL